MSYILDALRKADAQRERDPSRGIHAQPVPLGAPSSGTRPGSRAVLWGGIALGAVALGYAGWQLTREAPPPAVVAAPAVPAAPAAAPVPVPAPAAEVPAPATAVMPPPPPVVQAPPPAPAPAAANAPAPAPAPAANAEVRTSPPPDAPKLTITGGVYSTDKAQRMLIVNGQVFNEGAEPVPGVRLEQIRPNTAVLNFRGQRYSVGF